MQPVLAFGCNTGSQKEHRRTALLIQYTGFTPHRGTVDVELWRAPGMLKRIEVPGDFPVPVQDNDHVSQDVHGQAARVSLRARRIDLFDADQDRSLAVRQRLDGFVMERI